MIEKKLWRRTYLDRVEELIDDVIETGRLVAICKEQRFLHWHVILTKKRYWETKWQYEFKDVARCPLRRELEQWTFAVDGTSVRKSAIARFLNSPSFFNQTLKFLQRIWLVSVRAGCSVNIRREWKVHVQYIFVDSLLYTGQGCLPQYKECLLHWGSNYTQQSGIRPTAELIIPFLVFITYRTGLQYGLESGRSCWPVKQVLARSWLVSNRSKFDRPNNGFSSVMVRFWPAQNIEHISFKVRAD